MIRPLVLIIEDDPNLGSIFEKSMQQAGFDTMLDCDGSQYRRMLSEQTPDLVILDLHLPFASGSEILASLRENPQTASIPSLVVTADLYLARSIQANGEYVIMKPVSPLRLMELARQVLQPKDQQQS